MSGAQERPLRADAARNRARLLDVATQVFATRGVGVPTEEIARAAGVGVGTLFRHFPTKEALLEAVMVRRLETIAARAAQLPAESAPGETFFDCFRLVVEQSAGKSEFAQALAAAGVDAHAALAGVQRGDPGAARRAAGRGTAGRGGPPGAGPARAHRPAGRYDHDDGAPRERRVGPGTDLRGGLRRAAATLTGPSCVLGS